MGPALGSLARGDILPLLVVELWNGGAFAGSWTGGLDSEPIW